MNYSNFFIKKPIASSLMMIALLFSGLLSLNILPISSLPEIDYPTITVSANYPGANPEAIASLITAPLEKQLGQMPGLLNMRSTSSLSLSFITLQFSLKTSLDVAEQEVQSALNNSSSYLPKDLPNPPIYNKVNPADAPIITLGFTSKTMPLNKVRDLLETRFTQKISQILGVGIVKILGGKKPAIRIKINNLALKSYNLAIKDVENAIIDNNINGSKGSIDLENIVFSINSDDQLLTIEDYKNLVVASNGTNLIHLKNLAEIVFDSENIFEAAWLDQKPALLIMVQKQPGSNVIDVVNQIKLILPKVLADLPTEISAKIVNDRTISIKESIQKASYELFFAILLVVIVVFIFLQNLSITLIPLIAVPLSIITSFTLMNFFGFSINNLTLMSLIIATGFVVDDAIVMIENISRYHEEGLSPFEAAVKGSKQIAFTIFSLSVALISVLIPLFFMEDIIGRLFREFALTLTFTIICSAFISLTFIPMMYTYFVDLKHAIELKFITNIITKINELYGKSLTIILKHQRLVLTLALLCCILTMILFFNIPRGVFPIQDNGVINIKTLDDQHTSFEHKVAKQQEIITQLTNFKSSQHILSFIGISNDNPSINIGEINLVLTPYDTRYHITKIIGNLQKRLAKKLTSQVFLHSVEELSLADSHNTGLYQISITGLDQDSIESSTKILADQLSKHHEFSNLKIDSQNHGLSLDIKINRDYAASLGVNASDINQSLYSLFGQKQISTIFTQNNQYKVVIEQNKKIATGLNNLKNIYVKSSYSKHVPLAGLVEVKVKSAPLFFKRMNQFYEQNIYFDLSDETSLDKIVKIVAETVKKTNLSSKVNINFTGMIQIFIQASRNQIFLVYASVIVVYLILGMLYESFIHPITIISTLPSACIGALTILWLAGNGLDIIGLISIILLIGIVMKNAIMMIDFAIEQQKTGTSPEQAIYDACLIRLRPILMTSIASIVGAIPLILSSGTGSELRFILGISIISGLIFSQVLTLYSTPIIYLFFEKNFNKKFQPKT